MHTKSYFLLLPWFTLALLALAEPASAAGWDSLAQQWRAGGPLLWPIVAAGAIALVLSLERTCVLWRSRPAPPALGRALEALARGQGEDGLRALVQDKPHCPTCRLILAGLAQRGAPPEVLENSLMECMLAEQTRLERFLPTLSVLAAVAPLLGLLGTVTGMIKTFQALGAAREATLLSGGIAEALVTTQWGLTVAIAVMLVHHLLERRADRLLADLEERASALASALTLAQTQNPGEGPDAR